jgi:CRISPR system Cascade subunit CasC
MSRFIQLHLLTFYPPSNLNRDDTGRPKSAIMGGVERLRISSQAIKRAVRTSDVFQKKLAGHLGERTQRFGEEIEAYLLKQKGTKPDRAREIARAIAGVFGKVAEPAEAKGSAGKTKAEAPIARTAQLAIAVSMLEGQPTQIKPDQVLRRLDTAVDIAMFGRMLADNAEFNREAAVQIAHSVTTHKVAIEDDFYTAVDDLKAPSEDAGAGFMGELGFGSGVFYLYACVDKDLLVKNLGDDTKLAGEGLSALTEALATVSPTGKQASFASRARAQFVLAEKGDQQPRTLAGAFVRPVSGTDILQESITQLKKTREDMDKAYGACSDAHVIMNVVAGTGTLAEVQAFVAAV